MYQRFQSTFQWARISALLLVIMMIAFHKYLIATVLILLAVLYLRQKRSGRALSPFVEVPYALSIGLVNIGGAYMIGQMVVDESFTLSPLGPSFDPNILGGLFGAYAIIAGLLGLTIILMISHNLIRLWRRRPSKPWV